MKKITIIFILLLSFLNGFSTDYKYDGKGYCQDFAGVLNSSQISSLNAQLSEIRKRSTIEIAIVTIPSLSDQDGDIFNFSQELFNEWGIGKKSSNNGILIVLAINNRKSRIHVGYGMEPYLTDALSKRILENMKPYLKNGDYVGAFDFALSKIESSVQDAKNENIQTTVTKESVYISPEDKIKSEQEYTSSLLTFFSWIFIIVLISLVIYFIINKYNLFQSTKNDIKAKVKKNYNKVLSLISSIEFNNELNDSLKESIGTITDSFDHLIRKIDSIKFGIGNDKEFIQINEIVNRFENRSSEFIKECEKIIAEKERIEREELERKRRIIEENSLKKLIRNEMKISVESLIQDFQKFKDKFSKEFGFRSFIDCPDFQKNYNKANTLLNSSNSSDGLMIDSLNKILNKILDTKNLAEKYFHENLIKKSFLPKKISDLDTKLKSLSYTKSNKRHELFTLCENSIKLATTLVNQEEFEKTEVIILEITRNYESLVNDIKEQISVNNDLTLAKNSYESLSNKYTSGNSERTSIKAKAQNLLVKTFTEISSENFKYKKKDINEINSMIEKIKASYKKEQDDIEYERRRKQQQEDDDRRRNDSYYGNYSSSSYSSDSSSSYSSFDGGSSGGGGASSDW